MIERNLPLAFSAAGQDFTIEALTLADLVPVLAIEQRSHAHPWSRQNILSSLQGGHVCLGLNQGAGWIGYAVLSFAGGEAELLLFVVDRPWQGRGLASAFLRRILGWCEQRAQTVFLEVRGSNQPAIALYEAVGFNQVGERPNYYPAGSGRSEHALIYAYEG